MKIQKIADKGCLLNFLRVIRKWNNREQTKYRFYNTYSDWKEHVHNILNKNIANYDDMIHWLIGQKNNAQQKLDAVKVILIPAYISLIRVYKTFGERNDAIEKIIFLLIVIFFRQIFY